MARSITPTFFAKRNVTHSVFLSADSSMSSGPGSRPVMSPTLVSVFSSMMLIVFATRFVTATCVPSASERKLCAPLPVGIVFTTFWLRQSTTAT